MTGNHFRILLLLFLPVIASAQNRELDSVVKQLFQGFPVDSDETYVKFYLKEQKLVPDSDGRISLMYPGISLPAPDEKYLNYFNNDNSNCNEKRDGFHCRTTRIYFKYPNKRSYRFSLKNQVEQLKMFSAKTNARTWQDCERYTGTLYEFYRQETDKFPFLYIESFHNSYSFYLEYSKPFKK